ncbi:N-lysine methyltransferase KMT5A [Rhinatrema bivittatum]|uniref:N-lysine methyltransferase KMT5A n=1 Tax=Rhinatrema bivittatum TaxID=194408 RepID=UPI00112A71FA|nr:N-lysine methyltransferase KMT5A [Rhinatrema bivittatum]
MAKGKKMSRRPKEGKAEEVPTPMTGRTNENHPKMNGENVFLGQPKIYTYLNPNKSPSSRPPLQEENSSALLEVKCQGKPLNEMHKKTEEKRNLTNSTEPTIKCEDQKGKESGCASVEPLHNQKQETSEVQKNGAVLAGDKVDGKLETEKRSQPKPVPRRKAQGKNPQNRKVTDYFPVRRSCRKSKTELKSEEKRRIDELIESGKEEGMKIDIIDGKGRGVIATKNFSRGEFVVEYHGDLIEFTDAKKREALYAQDSSTGCYMYYFQYLSKTYCVDATQESHRLGRLINHSKNGNCHTKLHDINGIPHLILIASQDIKVGEELLYDYGDRSRASIEAHPWLKH